MERYKREIPFEEYLGNMEDIYPILSKTAEKHHTTLGVSYEEYLESLIYRLIDNTVLQIINGRIISGEENRRHYVHADRECRSNFDVTYMSSQMVKSFVNADEGLLINADGKVSDPNQKGAVLGKLTIPINEHNYLGLAHKLDSDIQFRYNTIKAYINMQEKLKLKPQSHTK